MDNKNQKQEKPWAHYSGHRPFSTAAVQTTISPSESIKYVIIIFN